MKFKVLRGSHGKGGWWWSPPAPRSWALSPVVGDLCLSRGFSVRGSVLQEKLVKSYDSQGSVCLGIEAQAGEEPVCMQTDCRRLRDVISINRIGTKSAEMKRDPSPGVTSLIPVASVILRQAKPRNCLPHSVTLVDSVLRAKDATLQSFPRPLRLGEDQFPFKRG